jgi:hypothetical protein
MAVDVEKVLPARVAVADVRQPHDIATADEERPAQDAGERKAAAQPGGHPGVDGGAPTGTKPVAQGAVDCRARPQPPRRDDHEPDRRQDGQTERRPTARRVEITLADGQQRRGEQPVEGDERQLVEQVAEPVAHVRWARLPRPRRRQGEQRAPRGDRHHHQIADRHSRHRTNPPTPPLRPAARGGPDMRAR